jgi:hypothetical protein
VHQTAFEWYGNNLHIGMTVGSKTSSGCRYHHLKHAIFKLYTLWIEIIAKEKEKLALSQPKSAVFWYWL